MSDNNKNKIPKDQEEAEKFYGDKYNNQRKRENLDELKKEKKQKEQKDKKKDKIADDERSDSNVLTHPKDKKDESYDVKHNEKE